MLSCAPRTFWSVKYVITLPRGEGANRLLRRPFGQPDYESRAAAGRGLDFDFSAVAGHDAENDGEPQTHTLTLFFGRKERFKDMLLCFFVHSDAVVCDPDLSHANIFETLGTDRNDAFTGMNGFTSVN